MTDGIHGLTRRRLLQAGLTAGTGGAVAGCTSPDSEPADGPASADGAGTTTPGGGRVFVPPHFHERRVAGTTNADGYAITLAYSVPDYYWTVDGRTTTRVTPENDDNVQLLAYVQLPDGGPVLPDVTVRATVTRDGTTVAEQTLVPTLSQRWGLFHGVNLGLGTYTEYPIELHVSEGPARLTRAYEGATDADASTTVPLDFDRGTMDSINTTYLEAADQQGAVQPASSDALPLNRQRPPDDLPGTVAAKGRSGGATLTALALDPDQSPHADSTPYLALLVSTPYNGFWLPRAELVATLTRNGEALYDGPLTPTLDPEVGYHYGAAVETLEGGESLAVSVSTPPQVARRQGYETAFLSMPDAELTLEP